MPIRALLDAHQIGLGETGNETWVRNVLQVLEHDGREPLHFAVSAAGTLQLRPFVPAARLHPVSVSSARRLAADLPVLLRRLGTQVVISQYTLPLARTAGVVAVHDLSFEDAAAREWIPPRTLARYRFTIRRSARRARVVVAPTAYTRDQLIRIYGLSPERVLVAPLALDPSVMPMLRSNTRTGGDHRVLCVGTVLPRKNLPVVAQAVAVLRDMGFDVRLRVVGPLRPAGQRDLTKMRGTLGDALEVLGSVTEEQLAAEYARADVLAFPSLFEGFGLPVVEAMAAGLPVVCSDATCLPEVAGGAALLVPPRDVRAWTEAIASILSDSSFATRLADAGRARAATFDWGRTGAVIREAVELAAG